MNAKTKNIGTSYELLVVFAGSLKDSETKKELEKWEAEIIKIGKVVEKTVWENRALAYKIKKEATGTYLVIHFEGEGSQIAELENALRLDQKVIRHLIYKTPKNYEWRDYSEEDLEYDFTKLQSLEEEKTEKRFTKKKPIIKTFAPKKVSTEKKIADIDDTKEAKLVPAKAGNQTAKKEVEKKPKADVGEIDKKLDDILADL
jgi:small subunit ribosomal protein S6